MRNINSPIQPLWTPTPERRSAARITHFQALIEKRFGQSFPNYSALHSWSVRENEKFWPLVAEYCGLEFERPATRVLLNGDLMPGAQWFSDAAFSFAANLLRHNADQPAIIYRSERGDREVVTFGELRTRVGRLAFWLKQHGVVEGDRVAAILPNIPDAVTGLLAAASLGAIWSSCSPDFGISAIVDRFAQIQPKVLMVANGYTYAGKRCLTDETTAAVLRALPSVKAVLRTENIVDVPAAPFPATRTLDAYGSGSEVAPRAFPFNHPLYILYSSGTTGAPKCIVHGAGGSLLQHAKEHALHCDIRPGERLFYATTCGWMMWNWLVSGLASGATIMLYDGSPFHPSPNALFDFVEQEEINVFGTSAKFIAAAEKAGVQPRKTHRLDALRAILSTGSPLLPAGFDYVYRDVKPDLCLSSISGGTDIVSCFALGNPAAPVYCGELQALGLGMDVRIFDDAGESICNKAGELVCCTPFPSMPLYFWNDPDNEKYRASYFSRFPNVWCHGDWAELTPQDGLIIYGRSDATLNPGGVRIGTAEIYRQVETFDEVAEAIAIGQEWEGDVRVILFLVLRPGYSLTEDLRHRIRAALRSNCSPRHVPAKIVAVDEIPRTISGKIVELAVRNIVHGRPVKNIDALANPQALDYFKDLAELQTE